MPVTRSRRVITSRSRPIKTSCTRGLQFDAKSMSTWNARLKAGGTTLPPRHCEEPLRRSNPESFSGGILDCFAALALTAFGAPAHPQLSSFVAATDLHSRGSFRPSFATSPSFVRGRREDRVPAGHPRSTVRRLRYKRLHSGIQVKPNNRPSLRSGLTAYAVLSPGSDALLPPSPCRWLMCTPGRAATSLQDLTHRPRASGPHGFTVREITPVVCAMSFAHGFPPCDSFRAGVACVHHGSSRVS